MFCEWFKSFCGGLRLERSILCNMPLIKSKVDECSKISLFVEIVEMLQVLDLSDFIFIILDV